MFTHRQPREVYRVYGEEEFFAEDQQQLAEEPAPAAASAAYLPVDEPLAHESAQVGPDIFDEYDTVARGTPLVQDSAQLTDPWASANASAALPDDDHYESLPPFSPLIATQTGSRRRTIGVGLLAAALGLLIGLIAVSGMRSGRQSVQTTPLTQKQTAKVATAPATITPRPRTPRHRAPVARPHRSSRPRPTRVSRRAPARTAPATHAVTVARLIDSQAPPGELPDRAQTPTYAPPSSSGGMEFGFEH
jgi:hypothetical protein